MSVDVYANGMEIACKAAAGKSIAAFPDTCLSPPSPPAGPVPIPYPNTASASDTTKGTTTVMICGEEVMLKDQSTFKTSTGDEAATKSLGMGVVTHAVQGEASFIVWSMDVKFEGQNVDRHLDLMLHNEQCTPANTVPVPYFSQMAVVPGAIELECEDGWTDCQKKQMKAKAAKMDAIAREKGGLTTRRTKGALRDAADTWQAKFWRDWNKTDPNEYTRWPEFADPSKQSSHFYDDCAKTDDPQAAGLEADHVQEVQLGGRVRGPFMWLDGAVNGASGRQIKAARIRGINKVTGFTTKNCD